MYSKRRAFKTSHNEIQFLLFVPKSKSFSCNKFFVTGDIPELGLWKHQQSRSLMLQYFRSEGSYWSLKLKVAAQRDINYRYFSANEEKDIHGKTQLKIIQWECELLPRKKTYEKSEFENSTLYDTFGYINKTSYSKRLQSGWLTSKSEIKIRIHHSAMNLYSQQSNLQNIYILCQYYNAKVKLFDSKVDVQSKCSIQPEGFLVPSCDNHKKKIAPYTKTTSSEAELKLPKEHGVLFNEKDFLCFHAETYDLVTTCFEISFFADYFDYPNYPPFFLGVTSFIHEAQTFCSTKRSLILLNASGECIGSLKVDILEITPLSFDMTMERSYVSYWHPRQTTLNIGHKGSGSTNKRKDVVKENTIASLKKAKDSAADFVEFDVHLSKDLIPIVFHDFEVMSIIKEKSGKVRMFGLPVHDISVSDLQELRLHKFNDDIVENYCGEMETESDDIEMNELSVFPKLEDCLLGVNELVGFNIELKYPQRYINNEHEMPNYFNRNLFLDRILDVVMKYKGNRRIIFSSFDADICIMCSRKQNKYPILFLTQGITTKYTDYMDYRTRSTESAVYFALENDLLGICAHAEELLNNCDLVKFIKDKNLVLFVWGTDLNNDENIKFFQNEKVHGLIYDNIHEKYLGVENIFETEMLISSLNISEKQQNDE